MYLTKTPSLVNCEVYDSTLTPFEIFFQQMLILTILTLLLKKEIYCKDSFSIRETNFALRSGLAWDRRLQKQ